LLLQTCLLFTPFPRQKLIQVPLSEEIQIAYGGRKVKKKIVIMGLQTEGTHQRATLQFRTCLGRSGRKGRQGQIVKSYHIAEDARVVGGEVKSVSCTCCTSDPQSVCWSPQMHNLFVQMQTHIQIGNLFVAVGCTQEEPSKRPALTCRRLTPPFDIESTNTDHKLCK
jgi:hypothetical protein